MSTNNITLNYHKCHHFQRAKLIIIKGHFFIKIRWHQLIDFAGNTCRRKMPSYSDFKYLQKVNAKCPQISDEKKSFVSLTNNFWSFKKRIKSYLSMEQNLFFSSEIWGDFSWTFWVTFHGHFWVTSRGHSRLKKGNQKVDMKHTKLVVCNKFLGCVYCGAAS